MAIQTGLLQFVPKWALDKRKAKEYRFTCLNTSETEFHSSMTDGIIVLNDNGWTMCGCIHDEQGFVAYWFTRIVE